MDEMVEDTGFWYTDYVDQGRRFLDHEAGHYPFFKTDDVFNRNPPSSTFSFLVGGVLECIAIIMWWFRLEKLKTKHALTHKDRVEETGDPNAAKLSGKDLLRGMIACAIDNDEPYFTIISYGATSFFFLGGLQEDYQTTFLVMIGYYFVSSLGDTARVLLAYTQYPTLADVQLFSDMDTNLKEKREEGEKEKDKTFETMEIVPNNIYEDMGRPRTIVFMIFATQILFICLVCFDVYSTPLTKCLDGTSDCPVVGTLGSYGFYLIGVFQACVYLLGPKTNFGQSEQNPGFWLILLLASKGDGSRILWEHPQKPPELSREYCSLKDNDGNVIYEGDQEKLYHCRTLNPGDTRMWRRFIMSYLVNGVGFHILVHALPIQVAMQSSIIGVVFRAVGMLYLVDLDDTKGFKLIITEQDNAELKGIGAKPITDEDAKDEDKEEESHAKTDEEETPLEPEPAKMDTVQEDSPFDEPAYKSAADAIIEEAQQKLADLLANGPKQKGALRKSTRGSQNFQTSTMLMNHGAAGVGALIGAGGKKKPEKKDTSAAAALQGSQDQYAAPGGTSGGGDGGGGGGDGGGGN